MYCDDGVISHVILKENIIPGSKTVHNLCSGGEGEKRAGERRNRGVSRKLKTCFTVNGPYTGNNVRERGQRSPRGWYQLMTHHLFKEAEGMGGGTSDPEPSHVPTWRLLDQGRSL